MSHSGDMMIRFEEDNFDKLVDKFLHLKDIETRWIEFVFQEYEDSLQDPPDMEDDDSQTFEEEHPQETEDI